MSVGGEHPSLPAVTRGIPTPNLLSRRQLCETLAREVFSNSFVCSRFSVGKQAREMPNSGSAPGYLHSYKHNLTVNKPWQRIRRFPPPRLTFGCLFPRPRSKTDPTRLRFWDRTLCGPSTPEGTATAGSWRRKIPHCPQGADVWGWKMNSLARISHLSAMCYVWERCDLERERKIFTRCGQIEDESHACVWTAVCTSLSELLRSSEKVQWHFISRCVKKLSRLWEKDKSALIKTSLIVAWVRMATQQTYPEACFTTRT